MKPRSRAAVFVMCNHTDLIADIAHEFQTPIAILFGNMDVIEKAAGETEKRKALHVMRCTIKDMSRTAQRLLDTAGDGILRRVDVAALLAEVGRDCAILAADKRIVFTVEPGEGIVLGDRRKVKEVILNLVSNAFKYTEAEGEVRAGCSAIEGNVRIFVEDTGCGVPLGHRERIFERFYRIPGSSAPGTGLGLFLSKRIVESYGGTIAVEFGRHKGSRFIVCLPAKKD